MTRMKNRQAKPSTSTPEHRAEEEDLARFCHAAAVRVFEMLDREEAEAGLPDPYSPRQARTRRIKAKSVHSVKSVVKKGVEK